MTIARQEQTSRPFISRQFLRFLLTGGTAAGINFGSRIVYNQWTGFSQAIILAYLTGMITAFILAKSFVFKDSTQPLHRSLLSFSLVNFVAILQTWGISIIMANYILPLTGVRLFVHDIAHATGIIIPVFSSYIGHKRWSFK